MKASEHVCARCSLSIKRVPPRNTWKHLGGGHAKSCGQAPDVFRRAEWDAIVALAKEQARLMVKLLRRLPLESR